MIHFQAPILVKVREGIRINLSHTVSHAVEKNLPQRRLKKEISDAVKAGTHKKPLEDGDYEEYTKMDTISFWFIGGTSLAYRVGEEIKAEDFERIVRDLEALEFRRKSDGKPSDIKADKKA